MKTAIHDALVLAEEPSINWTGSCLGQFLKIFKFRLYYLNCFEVIVGLSHPYFMRCLLMYFFNFSLSFVFV